MKKIEKAIWQSIEAHPAEAAPLQDMFSYIREDLLPKKQTESDVHTLAYKAARAEAFSVNYKLRPYIQSAMDLCASREQYETVGVLDELMFKSYLLSAQDIFDDYLQAVEYWKPLAKQFYRPRRHYLKRYVDAYQEVLDGKLDFLSISMPKRAGKLIAHDCPVLTTRGFKPHGELRPGDYVFGIDGRPVRVLYKHPDDYAVYRVKFSNGEEILTSAEHEWVVWDKHCNNYVIKETQELLKGGLKYLGRWRWLMPQCAPINTPDKDLPVDPYVLGAWLGDGTTTKPLMTNAREDKAIIEKMIRKGYPLQSAYIDKNYGTVISTFTSKLATELRSVGMCYRCDKGNKHIPETYFTTSFLQRVELLSGLVDTDGYVEHEKHRIAISTVLPRLRDDIIKLVSTFGLDCRYHTSKAKTSSSGIVGKHDVYTITFAPDFELLTALERKHNTPTERSRRISVREIERLDVPAKGNCITVEGGVYRVGIRQVLTHNSQLGINYTNMLSGRKPNNSTLMEGTGDALVKSFYRGCGEYLDPKSEYSFYDIFPGLRISETNADMKTINLDRRSRFPTIMCRSIDSSQVGLSEATNLLYLDDCVEGREEAKNRTRLDAKWEVISGDILGRAIEGTPIVICGTRYSLYDPIGRLQETMREQGKRMKVIEIPALDPITDESNFEYIREGRRIFTTEYFRNQRTMLSEEQWESEFQQQPFEAKGLMFPKDQLNYYYELPVDKEPDTVVFVCDTAEDGSDFLSMPIAKVYGDEVYVDDVVFDDSPAMVTKPECAKAIIDNHAASGTFESNNAGSYFAKDVQELLTERGYKCGIRLKRSISNKQTRIEFASDNIIKHFWFKHPSTYERGSQYDQFMHQVTTHTRSGKVEHDDGPDSLAMLENELRSVLTPPVEVFRRPF